MPALTKSRQTSPRHPRVVISQAALDRLEGLAEGAMQRSPGLADRLLDELGRARIVAPSKMPKNVVAIGNAVTYRDEASGQERVVTLVYPEDADIARQRISVMTPLGVALLGLAEGASFHWNTRAEQRRMLTVIRVAPAVADLGSGAVANATTARSAAHAAPGESRPVE